MLSGGTQRRAFASVPERKNNNSSSRVGMEPTTVALQSHLCACATTASGILNLYYKIYNEKINEAIVDNSKYYRERGTLSLCT